MRGHLVVLALAGTLLLGSVPAAAGTATGAAGGDGVALGGLGTISSPTQLRTALLEQAARLGGSATGEVVGEFPREERLEAASDLDGDGRNDVVAVETDGQTSIFRGLRGRDGVLLWEHTQAGDYGFVIPTDLGPEGDAGVLLMSLAFEEQGNDQGNSEFAASLSLAAFTDGDEPAWQRVFQGTGSFSEGGAVVAGLTFPVDFGQLVPSPAMDLALVTLDGYWGSPLPSSTVQVSALDGADGATTSLTTQPSNGSEAPGVIDDVDNDGLQDVALAVSDGTESVTVTAYSTGTRLPRWTTTVPTALAYQLQGAGDVDGDGVGDVLVMSHANDSRWAGDVTLLSGSTGGVAWTRPGDLAGGVADIDGDGVGDVVVHAPVSTRTRMGVRYAALRGDGTRIFRRRHLVRIPETDGDFFGIGLALWTSVGDVDRDRRPDVAFEMSSFSQEGHRARGAVVRAATGTATLRGPINPLYAAVDRRGDDFATYRWRKGRLLLRIRDGRDGDDIWRRTLRLDGRRPTYVSFAAVDVNGDRHAEVLMSAHGRHGSQVYVLNGRTGRIRWRR